MSKVLAGFLVLLGMAFFFSSRDSARFQALSPAEQYEERCRYGAMASTMAAEFIRLHLNIVESPKFETFNVEKLVKKERNAANDCIFTIEDHVIFKNESGGQSRRHARVAVTPTRGDNNRWNLVSILVR